jgi:hypothetical protein
VSAPQTIEAVFSPAKYPSLAAQDPGNKATPVVASGAGTTGVVSAAAAAGKLTYITALHVGETGTGGAAVTVTGLPVGLTFQTIAPGILNFTFDPPLPASAVNTAIVVSAAANASATAVAVTAIGFQA